MPSDTTSSPAGAAHSERASLSAAELNELTGYVRHSAQVRWLRKHGWRFSVNALGRPIVAVAEWSRKMVGSAASALTQQAEPNWNAVNGPEAIN